MSFEQWSGFSVASPFQRPPPPPPPPPPCERGIRCNSKDTCRFFHPVCRNGSGCYFKTTPRGCHFRHPVVTAASLVPCRAGPTCYFLRTKGRCKFSHAVRDSCKSTLVFRREVVKFCEEQKLRLLLINTNIPTIPTIKGPKSDAKDPDAKDDDKDAAKDAAKAPDDPDQRLDSFLDFKVRADQLLGSSALYYSCTQNGMEDILVKEVPCVVYCHAPRNKFDFEIAAQPYGSTEHTLVNILDGQPQATTQTKSHPPSQYTAGMWRWLHSKDVHNELKRNGGLGVEASLLGL